MRSFTIWIYYEDMSGEEKGYTGWFSSKEEMLKVFQRLGVSIRRISYMAVRKAGEDRKEVDPMLLESN